MILKALVFGVRLAVFAYICYGSARADPQGVVTSACGTPPYTYVTGGSNAITQNTTGNACVKATCSISPPVTYVVGGAYPILVDTDGQICSSGG